MKRVINSAIKEKQSDNKRVGLLRMELDYELATLHEAVRDENDEMKEKCIKNLERIRKELIKLGDL